MHLFTKHVGSPDFDCPIDDRGEIELDTHVALVMAAHVREFLEWEAAVDGLGYRMVKEDGQFALIPRDVHMEQSIRLAYMLTEMTWAKSLMDSKEGVSTVSLEKAAGFLSEKLGDRIVEHVHGPIERIRFNYPALVFTNASLLPAEGLYEEEAASLEQFANELMVSESELLEFQLTANLRLHELLRIHARFLFSCSF